MKRRIMLVTPWPNPADGIASHSQQVAAALCGSGEAEVTVLCHRRDPDLIRPDGITVVDGLGSPSSARAAVRRHAPDLLYVQFAVPAFGPALRSVVAACKTARSLGARVAVVFHEAVREHDRLGVACAQVYRPLLRHCDVPVVLTPAAGDVLVAMGVERSSIVEVPHGIRAMAPTDASPPWDATDPRPVALCLGFIHPDKGIDTAINAVRLLTNGREPLPVRLVVAGGVRRRDGIFRFFGSVDRRHADRLVAQVRAFGLSGSVEFTGFLSEEQMTAALRYATVAMLPYGSTTQSGVAALTTAAGIPVIASNLPGLTRALGRAAEYAEPGAPAAFAAALRRVLGDEALRQAMSAEQDRRRDEESMAAVAHRILALVPQQVPVGVR